MNIHNVERKTALVAETLKSLAHPKRLLLLCHMTAGEQTVGELARRLAWRESSVSQALMGLRREGMVAGRREGQHIHYAIARDDVRRLLGFLYATYCQDEDDPDHD
ncbi:ArsR/SmtB family transcription factor [Zavarzinia compransoris]|uniref:Transcriptional regulator n=1 Tax=Zavarzinia compransoris TaxID=1264899 RepID=A0A317DYA6_9PROT|nr:metalloregulator ArsR/SmtB family transcription factor [Zavarzinia compransoris]PWR19649.1 transcriptional regulator [Zavarzinia compransoris]TDP43409.1 ArsR family transcriptional regulator [Zavarzinia compransoris]